MLEVVRVGELKIVFVETELIEEERDTKDVLLLLAGEEEALAVELAVREELDSTLLVLALELDTLELIVWTTGGDDDTGMLLEMLETTIGSEKIDEICVLSWPGPKMLVGFENIAEAELELMGGIDCGKLDEELLTSAYKELETALDAVPVPCWTPLLLGTMEALPEVLVSIGTKDADNSEEGEISNDDS